MEIHRKGPWAVALTRCLCLATLLALGVVVPLRPAAAQATTTQATTDAQRLAVVDQMIKAWNTRDWEKAVNLFAPDGVLHSVMIEPIVGRDSIRKRITTLGAGLEQIELKVRNIGVINGLVFVERVDSFTYKGKRGAVPVVGIIDVQGNTIREWREYYDRAELLREMGLARDFDKEAR